jgi:hypothetical protein
LLFLRISFLDSLRIFSASGLVFLGGGAFGGSLTRGLRLNQLILAPPSSI